MGTVAAVADRYVPEWASLNPIGATYAGIAGHDDAVTDLSPDGYAARADLDRRTLAALASVSPGNERERVAREAMVERLTIEVELFDAGHTASEVNVIASALHSLRGAFDLMPTGGDEAAELLVARLGQVPAALGQWRETLLDATDRGHVAARQQILEVAGHCEAWADPDTDDVFPSLARRASRDVDQPLRIALERAARAAAEATAATGRFLRHELAARGRTNPACGRDRYQLASRYFLGAVVDLDEAYAWGFEELGRIETEMRAVAGQIVPGGTVDAAVAALDADPGRAIGDTAAFRTWMQSLADRTIADLHGTHFDIPEPVRRIECMIAPTSDGTIYYTAPSEDFSRPGRMWWAVPQAATAFSTWREVATVYHEGVPGHHLQIGTAMTSGDRLNRWQRLLCWCSGHGEGWALYAERLMDELGYFSDPGDRLGLLDAQSLRAARVIVDLGLHLELRIPRHTPQGFCPGERWTPELAWTFLRAHTRLPEKLLRFELNRYLGWPGQAPSYKIGERLWLRARESTRARQGAAFDLRAFHRDALALGSLGLGPLAEALSRL
ncbi:MAG: DUF885 domain-containing protein [Dactylosporangium sp.]|nr:DUF885 domain-containing protein [Dactylosporangium sp.]NNJ60909.1 DUF885 domain-containing protein [Dactylosporangium sp.]